MTVDLTPTERQALVDEALQIQRHYSYLKGDSPEDHKQRTKLKERYGQIDRILGSATKVQRDLAQAEAAYLRQQGVNRVSSGNAMAANPSRPSTDADSLVKCLFCAELIQQDARKCRHCGEGLNSVEMQELGQVKLTPPSEDGEPPFAGSGWQNLTPAQRTGCIGCLVFLVLVFLCMGGPCALVGTDTGQRDAPPRSYASDEPPPGHIESTAFVDPYGLSVGDQYRLSRKTPLMPLPPTAPPNQLLRAMAEHKELAPGSSFKVLEVLHKAGTPNYPWYNVIALSNGGEVMSGWINSIALAGQSLTPAQ